jgi:hypothetical protein
MDDGIGVSIGCVERKITRDEERGRAGEKLKAES